MVGRGWSCLLQYRTSKIERERESERQSERERERERERVAILAQAQKGGLGRGASDLRRGCSPRPPPSFKRKR